MPTYVCTLAENTVDERAKAAIAEALTRIHSEETGAPRFFVQVVIDEKRGGNRFLGGMPSERQVWIRGDIRGGRTDAQRQRLMLRIMAEVARIAGVREDEIWVYLCNLTPTDMVEYGHVLPQPGQEAAWFAQLPKQLQDDLARIGTTRETFRL